jgi:hypothetical protein
MEEVDGYANLKPEAAKVELVERGETLALTITYDASSSPFWAFRAWLPVPSAVVARAAVVRKGGY